MNGTTVRVTFVRGLLRVVRVSSSSSGLRVGDWVLADSVLAVSLPDVSLPDVSLPDVSLPGVSLPDVVVDDPGDRSVVTGGLVLVMVAVVVVEESDVSCGAEKEGSTKLSGARAGSLNWRATYDTASTTRTIATRPITLAPSTAGVRLCQGCSAGESSSS